MLAEAGGSLSGPPLRLDQVNPQGLSSTDNGVGIAMETSKSSHGDRPRKSPGASHVDLDPGYYLWSEVVFFFPKPMFGPGWMLQATRTGPALPTLLLILDATWICLSLSQ